ncbi:MAG: hypothetical protein QME94_15170 [Anaerolineae bacterium]|nr:hypothetical protein [Anaerolineae bacterium]
METYRRAAPRIAGALLLIVLGAALLVAEFTPGWQHLISGERDWPLSVIAVGVLLLVIGFIAGAPGMAVPGCVVGGIGGLLYWQNATHQWESWAYAWALIPGFVGIGLLLSALLQWRSDELKAGAWLVFISLALFSIFASAFGGISIFGPYWPALLIALGLVLLLRSLLRGR